MSDTENLTEKTKDIPQKLTEGLEDAIFDEKPPEYFWDNVFKNFEMLFGEELDLF